MNLNLQSKLDAILSFFDKQSSQKNQDLVTSAEQNKAKEERAAFVVALKDTLKNGGMNYDEAILRVRASEFSVEDKNIILAQLGEFEATPIKTASLKTQEVEEMDQVQKEIQRIGSKLPAYAAWLEETLKKDGYYMGTDGKPAVDQQSLDTQKNDLTNIKKDKEEEEKRMNRDNKRTTPEDRLMTPANQTSKAGSTDAYTKTPGGNATESSAVDSKKWDNGNETKDETQKSKDEAAGHTRDSKDTQRKNDTKVRASDGVDIKFSFNDNAWVITDKATGQIAVQATVEDITGGREIKGAALTDIKSAAFGEFIKEDIDNIGLEAMARNLLGNEKYDKIAAESLTADTTLKTGEDNTQRLFILKGMLATLKSNLSKVASHPGVAAIIKKAEGGLELIEEKMDAGAPEIPFAEAAAPMEDLVTIDETLTGGGDAAELGKIIHENVDQLVQMAAGESSEAPAEEAVETPAMEKEEHEAPAPKKEEKSENPFAKKEEPEKKESAVKAALRKLAADKNYGETAKAPKLEGGDQYGITPKLNWNELGEHSTGNIKQDGKEFMTFETLHNEFKGLATQVPSGKLAAFIGNLVKGAEMAKKAGMDPKTYYTQVLGDAAYVNEWASEKTPDQIQKEFKANEREANSGNNAYANGATKMKQAMELAQKMQKKGMISVGAEALNQQVKDFMDMNENSFKAYASSVEFVSPTSELEDGRFKVKKMAKPDHDGNVVVGAVDGIECVYMSGADVESEDGSVTKAHLEGALELLKRAFNEGFLEEALSGGKIQNTPGLDKDLAGLNVGLDAGKPILTPRDLI